MYKQIILFVVLVSAIFGLSKATLAVDISSQTNTSSFDCLKSNGYSYVIIRGLETGQPDPNGPESIENAWDGGMTKVDVYAVPCPLCVSSSGYGQILRMIQSIKAYNVKFGTIWLVVQGAGYWSTYRDENQAFFKDMINGANTDDYSVGVYTSASQWQQIMGSWNGAASYPLWYSNYDSNPSFSDFKPFGGWTSPTIKQYNSDQMVCELAVNQNYY
ncbi:hypothetical protein DFA_02762 [Cavenderia fasciculata]|uniref:Glycoside hydrolase family 25 protein n=1 Tax=Cavenderia fasciculata TaxID=261658 RepID=F4PI85_CACFS|nr:uncharacterized protein DFA_02762 [Cavenderia fasciculata]EGG24519.1 hypothetical protein DFA_02762 [Cavenderia fasciculata]|eukprot:XP_004362370.1 hypothetical protein DFA_02762 [Cavenderia fasciculata]